jgi:nucleoside 2-deoxyribosyltransferase
MATIYVAGPLFTAAERAWNLVLAQDLRRRFPGITVLLPQEFCAAFDAPAAGAPPDFAAIAATCRSHLHQADALLALIDGADADAGTAWEMGYATALDIPIVGLRTDWRPAEDGGGNCMLTRHCRHVVRTLADALPLLAELLAADGPAAALRAALAAETDPA